MIFQEISAGAISTQMPPCKAIVINVGETKGIGKELQELYSQQDYTVYIANTTLSKLGQVLNRCREAGIPAIVNCGELPPEAVIWHPEEDFSATLVSPGTTRECKEDILTELLDDPKVRSFSHIGYQGYR